MSDTYFQATGPTATAALHEAIVGFENMFGVKPAQALINPDAMKASDGTAITHFEGIRLVGAKLRHPVEVTDEKTGKKSILGWWLAAAGPAPSTIIPVSTGTLVQERMAI